MKRTYLRGLLVLTASLAWQSWNVAPAAAQKFDQVVTKIAATIEPATAKRGETVTWKLTVEIIPGWWTYPLRQVDPKVPNTTQITFKDSAAVVPVGDFNEPPFKTKAVPELEYKEMRYLPEKVVWERPLVVRPDAKPGEVTVEAIVTIEVCDKNSCLTPKKVPVSARLTISDEPPVAVDPRFKTELDKPVSPQVAPSPPPNQAAPGVGAESATEYKASLEKTLSQLQIGEATGESNGKGDLVSFLLAGVFWGFVSLITPCVFPMIPITVSFFLKQSEKEHHRPVVMALVYSGTIVVVLTIAAVLLLSFFRLLSVNPVMNFVLGGLFVFFALSLFGMYEIELPSSLANFTSAQQGRGGYVGTIFMALTFTIISFACVAPFLGGFGGTAITTQFTFFERVLGGLAFSVTFAAPFFLLAIFPTLLKKLPKSGSWLNSVKVVMGFLELAAAIKFFRAGELVQVAQPTFFTYDLTLGMYVAICVLCGLYLLNVFRLPHDSPLENIGVPRMLFGFLFLSLGFYLVPALFKQTEGGESQRPNGSVYAWIDSFLLPEPNEDKAWSGNLEQAIADSRADGKLIFVDFTGVNCTNCKFNERSVFSKPEIKELFQRYRLVQLYTDKVPNKLYPSAIRSTFGNSTTRQDADAGANLWFQRTAFNDEKLPLYVILKPLSNGKIDVLGIYREGKINDENAFAQFLQKPLQANGARAQASGK